MYAAENWEGGESCSAPAWVSLRGYGGVWEKGRVQVGACVLMVEGCVPFFHIHVSTQSKKREKSEADLGTRLTWE